VVVKSAAMGGLDKGATPDSFFNKVGGNVGW
jgi:hypothetical protein